MIPVDELVTPPSEDQVLEKFLSMLETLRIPARSWRKAGAFRTILRVVARTFADHSILMAAAIKGGFLETAEGEWLSNLAYYVYSVERRAATFAEGHVLFTNEGGGVHNKGPDEVRIKSPTTGKIYANTEALSLTSVGQQQTVAIRAVEQGAVGSAAPDTIIELETQLLGVAVTNPEAVFGSDAETDEELREHCRNKLAAISVRGPRGAYEFAVKEAKRNDGSPVDINRSAISPHSSKGTVTVFVASPTGTPASEDLTAIEDAIEQYARPDSVTVSVEAATEVAYSRSLVVWARRTAGVDTAMIKSFVEAKLLEAIRVYPVGGIPKPPATQGYLYADYIAGVVKSAHASIYDVDGTGADMALNPGEVATLATTITVNIRVS